jgi:predicted nucleic acid-binding protein
MGEFTPAFDARILDEYQEVLLRPKFGFDPDDVRDFLDSFAASGWYVTARPLNLTLPDPDDATFVEVAVAAAADCLVTGNVRHFPADRCQKIKVARPGEFWRAWLSR